MRAPSFIALALIGLTCTGPNESGSSEHRVRPPRYPEHWWKPVPKIEAADWEILPQEADRGEVILSKRNELGLLSNFAATPFDFDGVRYASLEGFWQMMKYPEDASDPRSRFSGISWKFTREQVAHLAGFDAKAAGDLASQNMRKMGIDWVSFKGRRMIYRERAKGDFFELIVEATRAKVRQNPQVREILLSTGDLALRPDHHQGVHAPPAWRYHEILIRIRDDLRRGAH